MKKVTWIYSINTDGKIVVGHVFNMNELVGKKFQAALTTALSPEIIIDFVSYDLNQKGLPPADLYVFNEKDDMYLDQSIKDHGLSIAYQDIYTNNLDKIQREIVDYFEQISKTGGK